MLKLVIVSAGLIFLTGCFESGIVTESNQLEEYIDDYGTDFNEDISVYFERPHYAFDERDEVFYIVENNSEQPIEISTLYQIEKYEEESWVTVENYTHSSEAMVEVLPKESSEQLIWLSFVTEDMEEGIYRLVTVLHYPHKTQAAQRVSPDRPAVNEEIRLLFEIK